MIRTPNLVHYVATVLRLMPHSVHVAIANRLRALPPEAHDPWPTVYRANSKSRLARLAGRAGFKMERCDMIESEPSYARASVALFFPMLIYERIVNSSIALARFRASITVVFRKAA